MDDNKLKALETVMGQLDKQFGKGVVMKLGDKPTMNVESLSTGSLGLDLAIGIGGVPKGRIIEVFGPESSGKTTIALHICAEAQKQGGVVAFVDAEHSLDPVYAKSLGVDVNNIIISQPDTGEEALEIAEALIRSGAVDVLVIDSVASLTPRAEIEGEMGQSHVGLQARLLSQALRKLTGTIQKTGCVAVFINQLREKVGVMFGCLHANTLVNFADGRNVPIREVVEKQIQGEVWSYNELLNKFEKKEIIDWHYNGDVVKNEDYIHFHTDALDHKGGVFGFTVTPNHKILTNNGWKESKNVVITDKILSKYKSKINNSLEDFLWGSFIGDSCILVRTNNTANYRIQDSKNEEYLNWKAEKIAPFINMKKEGSKYVSEYTSEFKIIKEELGERNPLVMFKNHYSDLGLAIWYMDDGHYSYADSHDRCSISVKRFKGDVNFGKDIVLAFKNIGIDVKYETNQGVIRFDKQNTHRFFSLISKYVPKCMQYKLSDEFKNKFKDFELDTITLNKEYFVAIRNIRFASDRQMRQKGKYDISIKDNHNYLVGGKGNGVIVHNSPEVTPGGRALKFFSSVRLDIRKIETLKQGDKFIGNKTRVKVVKNKVAPPFKIAEFDIMFGTGVDRTGEIIDIGVKQDIVKKSGAWFSYGEERLGQGRENSKNFLNENEEIREEILSKIIISLNE